MSLYRHVPHPHVAARKAAGPVKVADARPGGNPVTRFNTRAAVLITRAVGSMWCAYAFTVLALYGLPAAMHGGAAFVQWASSQFIQLVLLPIIIVGSAVLAEASDRLAKRQFDDVEVLLHGQSEQAAHLAAQDEKILAILNDLDTSTAGGLTAVLAEAKAARSSAEAAFAGVQAIASVVRDTGEKASQVHQMITAVVAPPVSMPRSPDPATTMTSVAKARKP